MRLNLFLACSLFLVTLCGSVLAAAPALPGSYWNLMALEEKGKPIKESENPPDVEFLASGKYGILHYGGMRQEGTYTSSGDHVSMKTEDGEDYITGTTTWNEATGTLEIDSGKWIMRLRVRKIGK